MDRSISDSALALMGVDVEPEGEKMLKLIDELSRSDRIMDLLLPVKKLAYDEFVPWARKQIQTNKLYFAKEGGLKILVEILRKHSPSQTQPQGIPAGGGPEPAIIELQSEIATVFWVFAETGELICELYRHGVVEVVLPLLRTNNMKLQTAALGFFMSFLEYDTKAHIATQVDRTLVPTIIGIAKKPPAPPPSQHQPAEDRNHLKTEFSNVLTGTLMALSLHYLTRNDLFSNGGIDLFLKAKGDPITNYFSCLGLAFILSDEFRVNKKKKQDSLNLLTCYVKTTTPIELRKLERSVGFLWSSFRPFMRLLDSKELAVLVFGALCFANFTYSDINRSIITSENLTGQLICFQWHPDRRISKYAQTIYDNLNSPNRTTIVPSLFDICEFTIKHKHKHLIPQLEKLNIKRRK